jgi:inosose dehydratase
MTLRFGCQTYTWQMSYDLYKDRLSHIMNVIAQAGFRSIEAEVCMMGNFYDDPSRFAEELERRNLHLAALTLALPWLSPMETDEEKNEADLLIDYLKSFPEAKLILVQLPGKDRKSLSERQRNCLSNVNAVAKRANERGIVSAFHPNSPQGSVFRTAEDYEVMFEGLDARYVGYCPDSGHIANGGMDVMYIFRKSRPMIQHVHFKDISADRRWRTMGEGVIDHPGIVKHLRDTGYEGWVMVEEESQYAEAEPDLATLANGRYIQQYLS